jgi:hypothetical protein
MIELTQDLPAPKYPGRPTKYPYRQMAVGQSFWVPRLHLNTTDWARATGFKFQTKRCAENGVPGMRTWRVA